MLEAVGAAHSDDSEDSEALPSARWSLRGSRALWLTTAFVGGGFLVGPLTNAVVRRLVPVGSDDWGGVAVVAAIVSAPILAACWIWFALQTQRLFALSRRRCWALVAAVWGLGSIPWLLPLNLSMPAYVGWAIEATAWLSMAVPYVLIAVLVCPDVRRLYRAAALLACVGLAAGWPTLSDDLVHRAAEEDRTAVGAPADMYLSVDVPGNEPYSYTYTGGVLQAVYDAPGFSSPMRDADDLVLTVCPSSDPAHCDWGETQIESDGLTTSCKPDSGRQWWCTGAYGVTTLAVRFGGLYVSLTVDSTADNPIPAAQLRLIVKTLHRLGDRELLEVISG